MHPDEHPCDAELLLTADGELSSRRNAQVRAHLNECLRCRQRVETMERGMEEFTLAYRNAAEDTGVRARSRALLKTRLEERGNWGTGWFGSGAQFAIVAFTIVVIGLAGAIGLEFRTRRTSFHARYDAGATPQLSLTPGAIRAVTRDEVCSGNAAEFAPRVPETLKKRVFAEYGMAPARADAFEVDYLVTPELGGTQDIRNLWPQPYSATVWNAHVKDDLEGRLHCMVCSGQIDLATAQHELSRDWISAYKKYFHSERPL